MDTLGIPRIHNRLAFGIHLRTMLGFKSPSWDNFNALPPVDRDLTKRSRRALLIEIQGQTVRRPVRPNILFPFLSCYLREALVMRVDGEEMNFAFVLVRKKRNLVPVRGELRNGYYLPGFP